MILIQMTIMDYKSTKIVSGVAADGLHSRRRITQQFARSYFIENFTNDLIFTFVENLTTIIFIEACRERTIENAVIEIFVKYTAILATCPVGFIIWSLAAHCGQSE